MCFIVGGCDKTDLEAKDCTALGYTRTSCDSETEIVYDTCVSKGEKYVKCTCNPNYYMLTEKPSNAEAYDIDECTKVDGKKLYRATCKSDYKYSLSTITREDGKTNSSVCDTGKTPVADGGICTMLYGPNANKVLYKDCDCDSTYKYKKETPGFSYDKGCTYKYGDNATTTLYSSVTCDTDNSYQGNACTLPSVEDKVYKHSQRGLSCRTCKCPERYKYASDKLSGNFKVSGNSCGDLYDSYTCMNGWTKEKCIKTRWDNDCEIKTNETYSDVKCYKTCADYNANYKGNSDCGDSNNTCVKVTSGTGTLTCYKKEPIKCPSGYTLGTCPSGKTCETKAAENDASKTCYKEKPVTCPSGYTLGTCPSDEVCRTVPLAGDYTKTCYKKLTCEDIKSAVTHLKYEKLVKTGQQKCKSNTGVSGENHCTDILEKREITYECTIKDLKSVKTGTYSAHSLSVSDDIEKTTEKYTRFDYGEGTVKTVEYNYGNDNTVYTNLHNGACYFNYGANGGNCKTTGDGDNTPSTGKVNITISDTGSCMQGYYFSCNGSGGDGRGYDYQSATISVYDKDTEEMHCFATGTNKTSCKDLEPGTYEVYVTSGADNVRNVCRSYNDIKGIKINNQEYTSQDSYYINFAAGTYTIIPLCYTVGN